MKTKIEFRGFVNHKEWAHYAWSVTINDETFEYKTGTGHATPRHGKGKNKSQTIYESEKPNRRPTLIDTVSCESTDSWAHVPKIDDVLHSLFSDARSGAESFDEFCDNYGYSNDSLKALDTYRACMSNAKRLRKALGAEYQNEENRVSELGL